jgi:hypothetical protein
MKATYKTDIKLGERYRDTQTGIEGIANAVIFFQYGCERVDLEFVAGGEVKGQSFDAPRLEHVATGKRATTTKTGGPDKASETLRRGAAVAR